MPLADDRPPLAAAVRPARPRGRRGRRRRRPESGGELAVSAERLAAATAALQRRLPVRRRRAPAIRSRLMRALETALDAGKDAWPLAAIRALWDALFAGHAARADQPGARGALAQPVRLPAAARLRPRSSTTGASSSSGSSTRRACASRARRSAGSSGGTCGSASPAGSAAPSRRSCSTRSRRSCCRGSSAAQGQARASRPAGGARVLAAAWRAASGWRRRPRRSSAPRCCRRSRRARPTDAEIWALGRLGARAPFAGPLNCVVPRADRRASGSPRCSRSRLAAPGADDASRSSSSRAASATASAISTRRCASRLAERLRARAARRARRAAGQRARPAREPGARAHLRRVAARRPAVTIRLMRQPRDHGIGVQAPVGARHAVPPTPAPRHNYGLPARRSPRRSARRSRRRR